MSRVRNKELEKKTNIMEYLKLEYGFKKGQKKFFFALLC